MIQTYVPFHKIYYYEIIIGKETLNNRQSFIKERLKDFYKSKSQVWERKHLYLLNSCFTLKQRKKGTFKTNLRESTSSTL